MLNFFNFMGCFNFNFFGLFDNTSMLEMQMFSTWDFMMWWYDMEMMLFEYIMDMLPCISFFFLLFDFFIKMEMKSNFQMITILFMKMNINMPLKIMMGVSYYKQMFITMYVYFMYMLFFMEHFFFMHYMFFFIGFDSMSTWLLYDMKDFYNLMKNNIFLNMYNKNVLHFWIKFFMIMITCTVMLPMVKFMWMIMFYTSMLFDMQMMLFFTTQNIFMYTIYLCMFVLYMMMNTMLLYTVQYLFMKMMSQLNIMQLLTINFLETNNLFKYNNMMFMIKIVKNMVLLINTYMMYTNPSFLYSTVDMYFFSNMNGLSMMYLLNFMKFIMKDFSFFMNYVNTISNYMTKNTAYLSMLYYFMHNQFMYWM